MITKEEARRKIAASQSARQRWLCALHLLSHQQDIPRCNRNKRWEELRALVEFIGDGIPLGLDEHDPALFKLLLRETAQLHNSGLYERVLRALYEKGKDLMAGAFLRGLPAKEATILDEGGSLSTRQVAKRLGITTGAVLKKTIDWQVIAWRDWRQEKLVYRYPAWQFEGRRLLPGIRNTLAHFAEVSRHINRRDDWGIMLFLLSSRKSQGGKRPLDLLRAGDVETVLHLLEADYGPKQSHSQTSRNDGNSGMLRGGSSITPLASGTGRGIAF